VGWQIFLQLVAHGQEPGAVDALIVVGLLIQQEGAMIAIRLDTNALIKLIESDPSFKLEITNAVLASVTKRYLKSIPDTTKSIVENIVARERDEILKGLVEYTNSNSWIASYKFTGPKADIIKKLTQTETNKACSQMIDQMVMETIQKFSNEIVSRVNCAVESVVKNEIKKQVADRVKRVLESATER